MSLSNEAIIQICISAPVAIANITALLKLFVEQKKSKVERAAINSKLDEAATIRQSIVEKVDTAAQSATVAATKAEELHAMTSDLKEKVEAHMTAEETRQ